VRTLALAFLLLVACAAAPPGPPVVHWGVDECSHCHMILSEPRYAAVARSTAGEEARFDDLGCMRAWRSELPTGARDAWTVWVHASVGEAWLPASVAWFVAAGAHTPMGSGLLAFTDRAAAAAAAPAGALPMSWQDLAPHSAVRPSHPSASGT
jgi:copper chaperone NosL